MYLPLTGYKEKDSNEVKMSIDSIGPPTNMQIVNPLDAAAKPSKETQKVESQQAPTQERQELSEEQKQQAVDGFYSGTGMSTQDFMALRTQAADEPFEVLDKVIAKMKDNMEEVGDAIEAMSEMVKKTSKDNIALQVLQKTLEAMDETSGTER
jgi:molecular chaperone GrpE (heat shock protein)